MPGGLRRAAMIVACVVATMAAGALPATAAVDSQVSLKVKKSKGRFHGRVTSTADDCVVGRKVVLYRHEGAHHKQKLEKTFASESGKYSVKIPMQHDNKIYAQVKRYETPMHTICGGDKSPYVTG